VNLAMISFFKLTVLEMMKHSHGCYTERTVRLCAAMSGAFSRELERVFCEGSLAEASPHEYDRAPSVLAEDVQHFVSSNINVSILCTIICINVYY
jgi:hypothetical protein